MNVRFRGHSITGLATGLGPTAVLRNLSRGQATSRIERTVQLPPPAMSGGRRSGRAFGAGRLIQVAMGLAKRTGAIDEPRRVLCERAVTRELPGRPVVVVKLDRLS